MKSSLRAVWRWVRWPLLVLVVAYVALVIYRIPAVMDKQKTAEAVAQIHAAKITLADVMGDTYIKLPVNQALNDSTVEGIDTNNNDIRDDVEMAIWKKYPNSAKIRAAELQYATAEQMYLTKVFNTGTWKAVAEESDRAYQCVSETGPTTSVPLSINFTIFHTREVESLVFNTQARKDAKQKAYDFTTSYGNKNSVLCDIDLSKLPN